MTSTILDGRVADYQRIVIAVDPSGRSGPEDERSDEVGIIVIALVIDNPSIKDGAVIRDDCGRTRCIP